MTLGYAERDAGLGGPKVRVDTIAGIDSQVVKLSYGAEGAEALISHGDPLPIYDFRLSAARGLVTNAELVRVSGIDEVSATSFETVRPNGGTFITMAAGDQTVTVVSTSTNDVNTSGTGAHNVTLSGLNASGAAQTEVVNLNGTTGVTSSNTWQAESPIGIKVGAVGSGGTNDGTITAKGTTDTGTEMGSCAPGHADSLDAVYTVPAGKTAYLIGWVPLFTHSSTTTTECLFRIQSNESFGGIWRTIAVAARGAGNGGSDALLAPIKLVEDTTIRVDAKASSANGTVSSEMVLFVLDN